MLLSVGSATEIDVSGGSCLSDVSVRLFLTLNACVSEYARFVVRVGSLVDVCRPYSITFTIITPILMSACSI